MKWTNEHVCKWKWLIYFLCQSAVLDLKTKEEKDAELDRRIEALRKKNEALMKRHQVLDVTQAFPAFTVYFMAPVCQVCSFEGCDIFMKNQNKMKQGVSFRIWYPL